MKLLFDVKYRPQIESGEYKVVTADHLPVEILKWDAGGCFPIVGLTILGDKSVEPRLYDKYGFLPYEGMRYCKPKPWLHIETPELAESEDERIRKFLKDYAIEMIAGLESDISISVYDGVKGHDPEAEAELEKWRSARAWLEKQKEQKPNIEICPHTKSKSFTEVYMKGYNGND